MTKYMFVYRNADTAAPPSPAEIQAALAKWGAWIEKYSKSGHIVDGGDGLKGSGRVLRPAGVVSDGPFVESKEVLGGYSIIQAKSYDEAVAVARECPCLDDEDGSIEIRELAGYV
jgi:hypothetical protein